MRSKLVRCVGLAIVTVAAIVGVHRTAAAEARTVLEEILDIMKQNGQITEEQRKALVERAEAEARQAKADQEKAELDRVSALQAGIESGRPFLRSGDGRFKFEIGGRLQTDYHATEGDARTLTGATLNDEFLVRRARLEFTGTFFKWIDLRVENELAQNAGTNGLTLKDGYLDLRFMPEFALRAGQFKEPFSLEELTSSRFLDFVERSILNELSPAHDIGAQAWGTVFGGAASYAFGVFNGAGQNNLDTNNGKDVAARIVLAPFRPAGTFWLKNLQVAGNVTWGDQDGATSARGRTSARTANRFEYFARQPTRGERTRLGGDLAWAVGPAALKFEYAEQQNERGRCSVISGGACAGGANLDDITARGWYVSGTWLLTGEDRPLNGTVNPKRAFSPGAPGLGPGAWEVALRYAELDFSSEDPVDFFDGSTANGVTGGGRTAENGVQALTAGLNWYWNSRVRTMLNWTSYWYDNPRGTPFSCPGGAVSCGAGTLRAVDDPTSWELLSRIQLWF